jgi:hypothetical protein
MQRFTAASAFGTSGAMAAGIGLAAVAVTALAVNDMMNSAKDIGLSDEDYAKKRGPRGEMELSAAKKVSDFGGAISGENARGADLDAKMAAWNKAHPPKKFDPNAEGAMGGTGAMGATLPNPPPPAVLARQARAKAVRGPNGTQITFETIDLPHGPGDYMADEASATALNYG